MTDQQINAAIAEACGWKAVCVQGDSGFYKGFDNGAELRPDLPDYCADLNAMHEAEKYIPDSFAHVYGNKLGMVTDVEDSLCLSFYCATARQRAEAFLRTLGKWEKEELEEKE